MSKIYNDFKEGRPGRGLARVSAILILIMVWILIDKGNACGQSEMQQSQVVVKQQKGGVFLSGSALAKNGRGDEDGDRPIEEDEDEETTFTAYPNPTKKDLVFDFEFTVKSAIPYDVMDSQGRLVDRGIFEEGVNRQELPMDGYNDGLYFVRLDVAGKSKVIRVVKQ